MATTWHWPQDRLEIIEFIRQGGVLAYPTEAVYGLGGDPNNAAVVTKILTYKRNRDPAKGIVLVADDWATCDGFIKPLTEQEIAEMKIMNDERATTFILHATDQVLEGLTDQKTGRIAVRVSTHPIAAGLSRALGSPIISTSANCSGCLPAKTAREVRSYFADIALIEGALGKQKRPSRIFDWDNKVVLRD